MTLRDYILSGPRAAVFAPLVESGNHAGILALLQEGAEPGYVPPRHVIASLLSDPTGFGGGLVWAWKHGIMPGGDPVDASLSVLLARLFYAADHPEYSFQLPPSDLAAGCDALGVADLKAAILAGEIKRTWAAVNLGREVTLADVSDALREP